jgi:hypothetical protein
MTDPHVQSAFLDLVDGHGPPHPTHVAPGCAACRQAAELRLQFERDFDVAMKEMAPQPLPSAILTAPIVGVSRTVPPLVGAVAAVLLVVGVAIAAPALFSGRTVTSPGDASPTPSALQPIPFEVLQLVTDAQQPYFEDGRIDAAEVRRAVESTVACVRDQGFRINATISDDLSIEWATEGTVPGFDAAFDSCRNELSRAVELAYQVSHGPSEAEMPAVLATIRCLIDAEVPAPEDIRPDHMREFIEGLPPDHAGRACAGHLP